jgi:hypothetical protein
MTFINLDNTGFYNRFYSVTGAFSLTPKILCFYQQPGCKTMPYLPQPNAYTVFIVRVNRDIINLHRGIATLIPIGPSPKLTASQQPAVSSFKAYQTPAH